MKYIIVECVISAHEAPMAIVSYMLSSSTIMRLHRPVFLIYMLMSTRANPHSTKATAKLLYKALGGQTPVSQKWLPLTPTMMLADANITA